MTEVKNSSVDLLARQMTGTRKRDEKSVDSSWDFKTMLKGSNQKKDSKEPEVKEEAEDLMAASEAAASVVAAGMAVVQTPDSESLKTGEELMTGFVEAIGTEEVPVSGEDKNIRTMDSFRTLDQFRLQMLKESGAGMEGLKEENQIKQSVDLAKVPQPLFAEQNQVPEEKAEKEEMMWSSSIQNTEVSGPVKDENGIAQNEPLTGTDENVLNPVEKEQPKIFEKVGSEEKKTSEEETRKDAPAELGGRPYQPVGSANRGSEKVEEVYVSANAENLEELELKLSEQILKQVHGGKKELDIQLEPHNLGKIRIKISYEDNQISVSLLCTESKTLKLLSQTAGDLGTILESNLERPFQIQVDKQENDYLNQQQDQNQRQDQREQHQGRQQDGNREDFIQRLRLGIFEMNGANEEGVGYR
ncbi:MAG: flagellar hook-length control protein FliK [Lacrimispora sp.]|uniref:flagellar hook-length control protein FliK n=1 Tax=Lacrimispora sp. TaxID=2719234 RepID=UPI0039E3A70E